MAVEAEPISPGRVHQRRQGNACVVRSHRQGQTITVQERLDEIGLGFYQLIVLLGVGGALLSESMEMGSVAPMHAALARVYGLTPGQRTALPMATFMGSGVGLAVAGILCDWKGRKSALVLSLIIIAGVMFATAGLPEDVMTFSLLVFLRFLAGVAGAIQVPAGMVLAVESCPSWARPRLILAVQLLGSFGYLLEAVGMAVFMPHFGEDDDDYWRSFCVLIGLSALLVLPFTFMLYESPSFLAVAKQDADELVLCEQVLDGIARWNGQPAMEQTLRLPSTTQDGRASGYQGNKSLQEVAEAFGVLVVSHWQMLVLLSVIDSTRSWYVTGSSYLWKDLFVETEGMDILTPARLNVLCSLAPIIGLVLTERILWMGVRRIAFLSTVVAACSMAFLVASEEVRHGAITLLFCVMCAKLIYAPLNSCIALIKAETFPTEIRVSAFCLVSTASKITSAIAPTLIEAWRGSAEASSWPHNRLLLYIWGLMGSILACGILTLTVPGRRGDGVAHLEDFFEEKRVPQLSSYGSFGNIWSLAPPEDEDGQLGSRYGLMVPRSQTSPNLMTSA